MSARKRRYLSLVIRLSRDGGVQEPLVGTLDVVGEGKGLAFQGYTQLLAHLERAVFGTKIRTGRGREGCPAVSPCYNSLMDPALRIRLLGAIEIIYKHKPLSLPTRKANLLFAYLALNRQKAMERPLLAGILWPDVPESRARRNLNTEIWRTRQALGDASEALEVTQTTIAFAPPFPYSLDIERLDSLPKDAPAADLRQAVEAYRGDFLPGYYEDWVITVQERLRTAFLHALTRLLEDARARGETAAAIPYARRILEYEPLRESIHRGLIELYLELGDRAAALRQYRQCAELLMQELGVTPLPETQDLYRQLVETFPRGLPEVFVGRENALRRLDDFASGEKQALLVAGESGSGKTALVTAWASRNNQPPVFAVTCPPPGVEASLAPITAALRALIECFGDRMIRELPAARRGELARLLPELGLSSRDQEGQIELPPAQARERLFGAVAGAIAGVGEPILLFFDDLHNADPDTLSLLQHVLLTLPAPVLRIVGAYQPEVIGLQPGHPLAEWATLNPPRVKLFLEPLTPAETGDLLQALAGTRAPPNALAQRLFRESEGSPLFIMEALRDMFDRGTLVRMPTGVWGLSVEGVVEEPSISAGIENLIRQRMERLPGDVLELLQIAAVLGSTFGFDHLLETSGISEEQVLKALDLSVRASLVREVGDGMRFRFVHEKFRLVLLEDTAEDRLKSLNGRAANALSSLYAGREEEVVERLANFWAGSSRPADAVPLLREAAAKAESLHAYDDALRFLDRAAQIMDSGELDDAHIRFEIEIGRLHCHQLLGRIGDLARRSGEALALAESLGPHHAARLGVILGRNRIGAGDWEAAQSVLEDARRQARLGGDARQEGEALLLLATLAYHTRQPGRRNEHLDEALKLAKAVEDPDLALSVRLEKAANQGLPRLRADALYEGYLEAQERGSFVVFIQFITSMIINLLYDGRFGKALETGEELVRLAEENGLESQKHSLFRVLARCRVEIGDFSTARDLAKRSLTRCRDSGYRYGEMRALACLASAEAGLENYDQAIPGFEHAMAISEELGARNEWFLIAAFVVDAWLHHPDEAALDAAERLAGRVLQAAREDDYPRARILAHTHLSRVCLRRGQASGAEAHSASAVRLMTAHGHAIGREHQVLFVRSQTLHGVGSETWQEPLIEARGELARKTCSLPSLNLKKMYLENIPIHRDICNTRLKT